MGCASSSPVGPPSKALKLLTAAVTADDEYKGPKPPTSSEKAAAQEVLSLKGCTLATSWQANAVAAVVPHMKALKKIDLSGCQFGGQGSLAVFGAFAKGQPEGLTVLVCMLGNRTMIFLFDAVCAERPAFESLS